MRCCLAQHRVPCLLLLEWPSAASPWAETAGGLGGRPGGRRPGGCKRRRQAVECKPWSQVGIIEMPGSEFDFEKARPRQLPRRPSSPAARSFLPLAALLLRSRVRSETLSRAQVLQVAGVEVWWVFTQIRGLLCRHCHRRGLLSPFYWVDDMRCHKWLLEPDSGHQTDNGTGTPPMDDDTPPTD